VYLDSVCKILWFVGIECTSCDSSSLQQRLSECSSSNLMSIRVAVLGGLVQLQDKSDLVEKAETGIELL